MGLWRMEVPALTELLTHSGHRGPSGLRFFVEPARWQAPCPPPCSLGLRQPRPATDDKVRAWKLEQVPAGHSYTDVHNIVRENGLKDAEFIANRHHPRVPGSSLARRAW
eukprot:9343223-Pyramimonas_sp.AAC.1